MAPSLAGLRMLEMGIGYDLSRYGARRLYASAVACGLSPTVWLTEVTMCGQKHAAYAFAPRQATEEEIIDGYGSDKYTIVMHSAVDVTAEFAAGQAARLDAGRCAETETGEGQE